MAQRDPYSWAESFANTQHQRAAQESQQSQNALMDVFRTETGRQDPYSQLPAQMALQNNAADNSLRNSQVGWARQDQATTSARMNMAPEKIGNLISDMSKTFGIDSDIMMTIAQLESNFNPGAKNGSSSAKGLWQFVDKTAKGYGLQNALDPVESTQAVMRLTRDNMGYLESQGIPINAGTLYMAHQQGAGGATKIMRAAQQNPNGPATATLGTQQVLLNGGRRGMTNQQFANLWLNKANGIYNQRVALRNKNKQTQDPLGGIDLSEAAQTTLVPEDG